MNEPQARRRLEFDQTKPRMTITIIVVTVLVYVLELILGGPNDNMVLVVLGAKVNSLIGRGQYWRLLTPALLHANLEHIALNMISLYLWGPNVEILYGKWKMLGVYVCAAVMGSAASYLLSPYLSVGASGAIFGLFGTLLSFGRDEPDFFRRVFGARVILLIVLNVLNGFVNTGIDNWAHLGGLLGGYLAAEMLGTFHRSHGKLRSFAAAAAYAVILAAILIAGPIYG